MTTFPIKIKAGLHNSQGKTDTTLIRELAIQHAQGVVTSLTDLTDSSTGTAIAAVAPKGPVLTLAPVTFTDTALGSNNLATKATVETGLSNVQDALGELFSKANAYATKLSIANVVYNGGGAAPDGTVNAISHSVTGGTTAPSTANLLPIVTSFNAAFYELMVLCNTVGYSLGATPLSLSTTSVFTSTVAALSTNTGTAVAPGVQVSDANAILTAYANDVATIAAFLNGLNNGIVIRVLAIH